MIARQKTRVFIFGFKWCVSAAGGNAKRTEAGGCKKKTARPRDALPFAIACLLVPSPAARLKFRIGFFRTNRGRSVETKE